MNKNKIYQYLLACCSLLFFATCSEEEVQPFTSELGANFVIIDQYGSYTDNYQNLTTTYNFYPQYLTKGMEVAQASIKVGVQLEGTLQDQPVNIRLKTLPVEDYESANLILPGDSIIAPGEYRRSLTIECQKPATFDVEYRNYVTFDYENSDIVPGTKERQQYTVIVKDATDWASMSVDNAEEWNQLYAPTLGQYGPMKVRFILAVMGELHNADYDTISMLYSYTTSYPAYGFQRYVSDFQAALEEYNTTHDKPLTEPDGTLVSFN